MQIIAKNNQSMWDLALTHSGSIEMAWEIAIRNHRSVTDSAGGMTLTIPSGGDPKIKNYLSVRSADPATDYNDINTFDNTFDNTFIW